MQLTSVFKRFLAIALAGAMVGLVANEPAAAVVYKEVDGRVIGEGEWFTARASLPGETMWLIRPLEVPEIAGDPPQTGGPLVSNFRGAGYVQSLPDEDPTGGGGANDFPEVTYTMKLDTPGTWQLYVRWDGNTANGGGSDSMFADIVELKDGAGGVIPDWYELGQGVNANYDSPTAWDAGGGFEQNVAGPANNPMLFNITAPGEYTLRFTQREDGSNVDAWALQHTGAGLQAPAGFGPAPTPDYGLSAAQTLTPDADTYVRLGGGQNDDNFGTSGSLLVKDAGTGSTTRKSYVRFDLSSANLNKLVDAELRFEVVTNNIGGGSDTPQVFTVNVFGLNDDAAGNDWVEGDGSTNLPTGGTTPPDQIVWNNAPANDTANNGLDLSQVTFLGQFGVPALNPDLEADPIYVSFNNLLSASPDAFLDFLNADSDGLVTFILTRDGGGGGPNLGFASMEHATALAPQLNLFGVPEPSSALLGLLGLAALARRRRAAA